MEKNSNKRKKYLNWECKVIISPASCDSHGLLE